MFKEVGYIIQGTINETFNLYRLQGRYLYSLSFSLSVLVNFAGFILAFAITMLSNYFFDEEIPFEMDLSAFLGTSYFMEKLIRNFNAFYVFSIALYSIWLHKSYVSGFTLRTSLKQFFSSFTQKETGHIVYLFVALLVFSVLLSRELFSYYYGGNGWIDVQTGLYDDLKTAVLYNYIELLYNSSYHVLPYFLAMFLIYLSIKDQFADKRFQKFRVVIFSGILICFLLNVLNYHVFLFVKDYIIGFITAIVPFRESLIPMVLMFCVLLVVTAMVYLASASFFYQPFAIRKADENASKTEEQSDAKEMKF